MNNRDNSAAPHQIALQKPLRSLLAGFRFLTIFPTFASGENDGDYLPGALFYFPVIGLIVGAVTAAVYGIVSSATSPLVSSVITVIMLSLVSGFLHLDGLADTADGFMSSRSSSRCLEIMRDSRTGVMGCGAICGVWLLKTSALLSIAEAEIATGVIVAATAGRVAIVCLMSLLPYAREEGGLASLFAPSAERGAPLVSLLFFALIVVIMSWGRLLPAMVALVAVLALFALLCRRRIGGYTGDTLGAVCELTETAVLLSFTI